MTEGLGGPGGSLEPRESDLVGDDEDVVERDGAGGEPESGVGDPDDITEAHGGSFDGSPHTP